MDPNDIPEGRLFKDLAWLWPVMSPVEEYAEEAAIWRRVLSEKLQPERPHVLELGVGGGHNLSHLTGDVDATAVDISPHMLRHSMTLNPGVEHIVGDMRCIRLGRFFDAVLIHDAISCITTARDLSAVFTTAAAHLEPGGLVVLSPEYFPEELSLPRVECHTSEKDGIQLTYVEYTHDPDPADTILEVLFTYFIRSDGKVQIEHDRIEVGAFSRATWRHLIHTSGFDYDECSVHLKSADINYTLLIGTLR